MMFIRGCSFSVLYSTMTRLVTFDDGIDFLAKALVELDVDELDLAAHFRQDRLEPGVKGREDLVPVVELARLRVYLGADVDRNGVRIAEDIDLVLTSLTRPEFFAMMSSPSSVFAILTPAYTLSFSFTRSSGSPFSVYLGDHPLDDEIAAPHGDGFLFLGLDGFEVISFTNDRVVELDLALLNRAGRDTADVEGPHGQLRSRLADRLGGDDAHRLADVDRHARWPGSGRSTSRRRRAWPRR